jgi:hypothetical protein
MAKTRDKSQEDSAVGEGELRGGPVMGTAVISGATFTNKSVTYYEVGGVALIEGDIALGSVEAVKAATDAAREAVASDPQIAFGVGIPGSQFRWPNCRIPFEIDPALPNQQRVTDAIAHWEARTAFRFPARTAADPNWVRFTDAGGCWSRVGMQGGQQLISLGAGCSAGNAIHEIGHTVGLWHEQSREDRDLFVTINWQNIQAGMAAQFNQHITDGDDLGAYDYGSIMHYPRTAFSSNGQDTITPTDPNAQIGQRTGLSAGDISAVTTMYPGCAVIKKPWVELAKKVRDERPPIKKITDEVPPFKKVRDDGRFKKIRDDEIIVKSIRDPKGPRDPGPIKNSFDPMPFGRPSIVTQPGGLRPFTIATPHHAPGMAPTDAMSTGAAEGATAYADVLHRQLLELEAAIAQAHATAAQAQADAARLQEASNQVASEYEQAVADLGGSA